jgi:hypothetical protein
MRTPDKVAKMLPVTSLGWGTKRISAEPGYGPNAVRRYFEAQGWMPYCRSRRDRALAGLEKWEGAQTRATVRCETLPGRQLQIRFGDLKVPIGGVSQRVVAAISGCFGHWRRDVPWAGFAATRWRRTYDIQ